MGPRKDRSRPTTDLAATRSFTRTLGHTIPSQKAVNRIITAALRPRTTSKSITPGKTKAKPSHSGGSKETQKTPDNGTTRRNNTTVIELTRKTAAKSSTKSRSAKRTKRRTSSGMAGTLKPRKNSTKSGIAMIRTTCRTGPSVANHGTIGSTAQPRTLMIRETSIATLYSTK